MSETRLEPTTRAVEAAIEIGVSPETVWRALTEARELERWFPLEARVKPGEGGTVFMSWKNEYEAESRITVWEPGRHLQITWGFTDEEREITQFTDFHLEGGKGRTVLRVVTSGFPDDPSWDAWYEGTRQGWAYELASLKRYLERYMGQDRDVVYLRRRVKMSGREAWDRLFGPGGLPPRPLDSRPFIESPPVHYAGTVEDRNALVRVGTEPCMGQPDFRDVTLWVSAWGREPQDLDPLRNEWAALLERLYPEGETL
ncbi:MAG TPA: SRPBCC domain-containing protein [Gemmatimonadota bacterium]|nr:SRPBCC domain-containing protein [Gemmatimonadota bacterium]